MTTVPWIKRTKATTTASSLAQPDLCTTTAKMGQITVLRLIYCLTETSEVTSSLSMSRRLLLYKFVNRSSTKQY